MTILSLEAKIDELEKELAESKQELEILKNNYSSNTAPGRWKPKDGEVYYAITGDGSPIMLHFNEEADSNFWRIGNCFKTLKEADFMIQKLKVLAELSAYTESRDRYWGDEDVKHYFIYYDYILNQIRIDQCYGVKEAPVFFGTREDAQEAINAIGEEKLKIYYFNVRK